MSEKNYEVLTTAQVAELLQVSPLVVRTMSREGKLPYGMVGSVRRYRKSVILDMFNQSHIDPRYHAAKHLYDEDDE